MAGRGRPRQLSLEEVVDSALALIDEHGVEALSLRALAARLGTGSATLYGYVESRDELIALMLGRSLADQPHLSPATSVDDFAEGLVGYLLASFRTAIAKPALLQLWHQHPQVPLGATAHVQEELSALEAIGFSATRAAEVHRMLSSQALGHIAQSITFGGRARTAPATSQLGKAQRHLDALGEERIYELALRALVSALVAELLGEPNERNAHADHLG